MLSGAYDNAKIHAVTVVWYKFLCVFLCPISAWPWYFPSTVCITSAPQLVTQSPRQNVSAILGSLSCS